MSTFRVLWNDTDDPSGGRWMDVDATDEAHATWQAATTAGPGSTFLAVGNMTPPPPPPAE